MKDKPTRTLRVGFIPLTDCAPLAVAAHKGFDRRHGIRLELSREASWAAIRDKLLTGEIDAAHSLYGMIYGVQLGIGGPRQDMAVLTTLSRNGQAITLSQRLHDQGVGDGAALAERIRHAGRRHTFAQTFPTGTHAMWLNYWLAGHGIHPYQDINNIVIPPPQMGGHLALGNIDGFCAGEPWNAYAAEDGSGFTVATSQQVWPDHPEKVLACTLDFVERQPDAARALIRTVLEAARYLDTVEGRGEAAAILARSDVVDVPQDLIEGRLHGRYLDGRGNAWQDEHPMAFFDDGRVTFPWLSDGMWFMTQHYRWGMLAEHPDYLAVASQVNQIGLYREAADQVGVHLPQGVMRSSVLMDGRPWDGSAPVAYAEGFEISGRHLLEAA